MVIAAIFAGGIGSRMGNSDTPKQYLELGTKPVIIHTIEKFFINDKIDEILVLCPKAWVAHTRDLVAKHLPDGKKITVIAGGATRNGTLENAIAYIEENCETDENTIIVTHDAVRPFLTHRIICENVEAAEKYGACDTVIPATDTIVASEDGSMISSSPSAARCIRVRPRNHSASRSLRECSRASPRMRKLSSPTPARYSPSKASLSTWWRARYSTSR